jgi:hypothetical protein
MLENHDRTMTIRGRVSFLMTYAKITVTTAQAVHALMIYAKIT